MTKKNNKLNGTLFKKLMAGASALAVVTGLSTQAVGALVTDDGNGNVTLTNAGGLNVVGVFNDNDNFYFTNAGKSLTTGGPVTIGSIDLNGQAPGGQFVVAHATTVGPIVDVAGLGANTLNIRLNANQALTLANNAGVDAGNGAILAGTFTGVGNILLRNNSNLIVDTNATLAGTIDADGGANRGTITINGGKTLTLDGAIGGNSPINFIEIADTAIVNLNADAELTKFNLTGADSVLNVADGITITGDVDANGVNEGKLIFAEDGTVTGDVGATNALGLIRLDGADGKTVEFQGAIKAKTLQLAAGADATLKAGGTISTLTIGDDDSTVFIGDVAAATLTFDGDVEAINLTVDNNNIVFAHADSVLRFDSKNGKQVIVNLNDVLDPQAANEGKLILHAEGDDGGGLAAVNSSLRITGGAGKALGVAGGNLLKEVAVSGDKTVTSEVPINTTTLAIAAGSRLNYAPGAAVSLNAVTFADAASTLSLVGRAANTTFTLNGHVNPGGNGRGIVILDSTVKNVILDGNGGLKTLGTGVNKIVELRAIGANNTITANVDLTNVNAVNVKNGGTLASQTKTIFDVAAVTIGENGVGAGTLVADSEGQANINVLNGTAITFDHADSLLKLTNTTNGNHATFTLKGSLVPGGLPDDLKGKLEIDATGTKTITIAKNGAETIGQDGTHRLHTLTISGDQNVVVNPDTFAKNLIISNTAAVTFGNTLFGGNAGAVESSMSVTAAGGDITLNGNTTYKSIDFGGFAREVHLDNLRTLTASTITNGGNTILTFDNNGSLTLVGTKTVNLSKINAGANAATVTLGEGTYTVTDIQMLHNGGTIKLNNNFILNGGFNVAGGANGTVKFLGNATVNGVLGGAGNALGAVTVAGVSTLQLKGNVNVASLDGTAGNAQTLKFINNADITVTGGVGLLQQFNVVEFNGAHKVEFQTAGVIGSPTLHFTANADVVTNGFDLAATNITQAGAGAAKLTVNVNQTLTGNTAAFGTLHVDGNKTIDINTANFAANITTQTNNHATINFNTNGTAAGTIGTGGEKVHEINFNETVNVGAVHATDIKVNANGVATFRGAVDANSFTFHDNAAEARFGNINLGVRLAANAGGNGIANFDQTVIQADVGADGARLAAVNFAASEAHVDADIYANAIDLAAGGTITLDGASTFTGATTTGANSILNLTEHDITFKGGAATLGNGTTIKTTVNGANLGNFVAGAGSNITLANKLNIEVTLAGALPANQQRVTLIKKDGGATVLDLNNITVTKNGGAFTSWRTEILNGELILTNESKVAEVIAAAAEEEGLSDVITEDIAQAFEDFTPGTEGESVVTLFNSFMAADGSPDEKVISDGVARLSNTTANEVVNASMEQLAMTSNVLTDRLLDITATTLVSLPIQAAPISTTPTGGGSTIGAPSTNAPASGGGSTSVKGTAPQGEQSKATRTTSSTQTGIAAGDDQDRYGAWMAPFYSRNTQKKRSASSGYKLDTYGGTFGFDTKASDELLIGLAFTAANSDIKHKDFKSGDKTRLGSMLFSAYSSYQFGNNWFSQGVLSVGNSNIKNRENRRISTTAYGIAEAEYSSMTFAGELLAGYNYLMKDAVVITPTFGIGYSRVNDSSYKETGNVGSQLLNVTKKASQKFDLVAGLRVTGMPFIVGEMSLSPDLHASVRHDVIGKGAKVDATIPGLKVLSEKAKLQKTYFNVGAGVRATYGSMDYGAGIDTTLAKKYVGVTGSLNVRVNF